MRPSQQSYVLTRPAAKRRVLTNNHMSEFNIAGHTCQFKGVPYAALANYHPTPRTYLYAWKSHEPTTNLFLTMAATAGHIIGAIEREPYLAAQDDKAIVYLIEHPAQSYLEQLRWWLGALCGTNSALYCPYHQRLEDYERDMQQLSEDIEFGFLHRKLLNDMKAKL